jgi:hypothetical protein
MDRFVLASLGPSLIGEHTCPRPRPQAGEGKKEDGTSDLLAPLDENSTVNEALPQIRAELAARREDGKLDCYGHYLLGLVYAAQVRHRPGPSPRYCCVEGALVWMDIGVCVCVCVCVCVGRVCG